MKVCRRYRYALQNGFFNYRTHLYLMRISFDYVCLIVFFNYFYMFIKLGSVSHELNIDECDMSKP